MNELKIYNYRGIIGITIIFLGSVVSLIVISIVAPGRTDGKLLLEIYCPICCIGILFSLISFIYLLRCKTIINDTCIKSFNKGKTKTIELNSLKRICVVNFRRLNGKIKKIIFDDGTFNEYESYEEIAAKVVKLNSWIVLDYSKKKLQQITDKLTTCPIETIEIVSN